LATAFGGFEVHRVATCDARLHAAVVADSSRIHPAIVPTCIAEAQAPMTSTGTTPLIPHRANAIWRGDSGITLILRPKYIRTTSVVSIFV